MAATQTGDPRTPVAIIFDTDMHTDCDDAGALAVLHALADEGRARILGTLHTAPTPFGPPCLDAINTYYGRGEIPLGGMTWPEYATDPRYSHYRLCAKHVEDTGADYVQAVAESFPRTHNGAPVPDSVVQYRRLLAAAEDHSVVVCAVGQLAGLAGLMDSKPDDISPLDGMELIRRKIRLFVSMAYGTWPKGRDGFNWRCDVPSAARVINHWPGPLAVIPHGADVLTGKELVATTPADNPVRRVYEIYVKRDDHRRSSWDQCAVLYAVNGTDGLFQEKTGERIHIDPETGEHTWVADPSSPQIYVEQVASDETLTQRVEALMCRPPKQRKAD